MRKYMLKRILFSLFSLLVVVMVVMLLVYTAIERSSIFQTDDVWNKKSANDRVIYEYTMYSKYGYLNYVDYTNYIKSKYTELYGADYAASKEFIADKAAIQKSDWKDNESVKEFIQKYGTQGYKLRYLEPLKYKSGKTKPGGTGYLIAIQEKNVVWRLLDYIKGFITELEQTSKLELDFTNEAFNLERFRELNAARERVESPKCYREFTNEAILTESFVTGTEVGDLAFLETLDDEERDLLAELVADNFATQVLTDGFYHADPHSGNVLIKDLPPREEDKPEAAASEETPEAVEPADGSAAGEADEPAADEAASDEAADADAAEEQPKLPQHGIEWIDFGMMGTLTTQQRQLLIDLVSNIVMHDAYALKRTVLKVATPQGEINHGALLEMCEGMCDQYTGDDFGDFALGDLLDTILSGLQDEEYKIDPFLTNLSRGIIAVEGTVRTLSPRVNILNNFMDKVTIGFGSGPELTDEEIEEMAPQIAMQAVKVLAAICTKGGETLDMLEKGQIRTRTDFAFEEKALGSVERLVGYAVRAVLIAAILIGSCLLCTVPINAMETTPFLIAFPVLGSIGYLVCVFFAYRLYRDVKNGK